MDLQRISAEMEENFEQAGMRSVEELIDKLEGAAEQVRGGPASILREAQEKLKDLRAEIRLISAKPGSFLEPDDGCLAGCASWYGSSVAKRLGALEAEASSIVGSLAELLAETEAPLKQISDTFAGAMEKLEGSVKALAKLPKLLAAMIKDVDSPDDIAKINTQPMKDALSAGDIQEPLDAIRDLKELLERMVGAMQTRIHIIHAFVKSVPRKAKEAFAAPTPCCAFTDMLLRKPPAAASQLLATIDKLHKVPLEQVLDALVRISSTIGSLDMDAVKAPVNKFSASAKERVEELDGMVQAAKLAANPGGIFTEAMRSLGKLFS